MNEQFIEPSHGSINSYYDMSYAQFDVFEAVNNGDEKDKILGNPMFPLRYARRFLNKNLNILTFNTYCSSRII